MNLRIASLVLASLSLSSFVGCSDNADRAAKFSYTVSYSDKATFEPNVLRRDVVFGRDMPVMQTSLALGVGTLKTSSSSANSYEISILEGDQVRLRALCTESSTSNATGMIDIPAHDMSDGSKYVLYITVERASCVSAK